MTMKHVHVMTKPEKHSKEPNERNKGKRSQGHVVNIVDSEVELTDDAT